MQKLWLCLLICVGIVAANLNAKEQFAEYVQRFNKPYADDASEYELRFQNFVQSLKRIEQLKRTSPKATFAINKFSDLSEEEFAQQRLSKMKYSPSALAQSCLANGVTATPPIPSALPTSFDWRSKGVVTPIKNQEQCGSCWAFSTIGVIESQWALKGNPLTQFSEQLLVDCSKGCCLEEGQTVCNSGCDGGWQWNAYIDVLAWGGVELESEYPYTGVDGSCAKKNRSSLLAPIKNYTCLSIGNGGANEDSMAAYLVANGPLAIALNAGYLQDYDSGIIDPWFGWECDGTQLDHALVLVGFGQETSELDGTTNYWIVKNSWGSDWGEQGYFRIVRGSGCCGINNAVSAVIM